MIVIVVKPYVGFPNGTAATSRVASYARGLAEAGEDVHAILLGPSELDEAHALNTHTSGEDRSVPFEYTSVSTVKSPSFLVRRWRVIASLLRARRRIRELHASGGVDAVLLYSSQMSTAAFFHRVCRSIGAVYALDLAEVPLYWLPPGPDRDAKQDRFARRFIGRFDVVVAITSYLESFARRFLAPGAETVRIPIMVDADEFLAPTPPASGPRLVVYVGMLNERKDGVASLLTAFSRIAADFPDVDLRLVGDSDDARVSNVPEFRQLAASLGVADRVQFTGQVSRTDVPGHLRDASVLVLARPSSQQAEAGFPTKLGEYLASGRPTVVTRTSDISAYLTDGESAYLVPPDDVAALAEALRRVLADPDAAAAVGAAGRRVAVECFDYRQAGRRLADVIRQREGPSLPAARS